MSHAQNKQAEFRGQFSGHETFPARYGWFKKVIDAFQERKREKWEDIFEPNHAISHFGVGKNMVLSMKHWALAAGLLEQDRSRGLKVSRIGKLVFGKNGLDPYMELPATLWLFHWKIAGTPERTTTWYWTFNHYPSLTFDRDVLVTDLIALSRESGWRQVTRNTLRRDVDCFIRTYVVARDNKGRVKEDSLECPLAELELIRPSAIRGQYGFQLGPKPTLPDAVFNYALAEFWIRNASSETIALERLTYEPGSPGRTFKLDERSVAERLTRIEHTSNGAFRWTETAGLQQVQRVQARVDPLHLLQYGYACSRPQRSAA